MLATSRIAQSMQIQYFKSMWGFEHMPFTEFLEKSRLAGYHGIESPMVVDPHAIRENGLLYVAQGFPVTLDEMERDIAEAHRQGALLLNLHVGKDHWHQTVAGAFLEGACVLAKESPIPVAFETHRGRLFYSASSTLAFLDRFPEVRLTADFSHWTCVSESMLGDQEIALEAAIQKSVYIHARVGHEEGPQVADPRVDRWSAQLDAFGRWWKRIAAAHRERGERVLRINPEFGPPNYMTMDPNGDRPLADLWEVCLWMRDWLEESLNQDTQTHSTHRPAHRARRRQKA